MFKSFILLSSLFLSFNAVADIEVRTTANWSYISNIIGQENPESTLLIYDIDKTLLHFVEDCEAKGFIQQLYKCDVSLAQKSTLKIVQKFQKLGFNTFALTARTPVMLDKTLAHLKALNFDFKHSSPLVQEGVFSHEDYPGFGISEKQTPILQDGVYMSGATKKGNSLQMLISTFKLKYNKIIFVDDGVQNIRSLINSFKEDTLNDVTAIYYHRYHDAEKKEKGLKSIKRTLSKFKNKLK